MIGVAPKNALPWLVVIEGRNTVLVSAARLRLEQRYRLRKAT